MDKKIRILVAKPGLDGHDRGAKVVAHALKDAGFEVIYTGLHQTVEQVVQTALQEDVDVIGLSILSGAQIPITESLFQLMKANQMDDVKVLLGGCIPVKDHKALYDLGVNKIFPNGSRFDDIVDHVKSLAEGGGAQ